MNKNNYINSLETGDILLYSENKFFYEKLIQYFTKSIYTHVAMIIKNPTFTNPPLKGLYVIESGIENFKDSENNQFKFGVQIVSLEKILNNWTGNIYIRKLHYNRDEIFYNNLKLAHEIVHDKPYDLVLTDWIKATFQVNLGDTKKTNTFWCSALISFLYTKLNLLDNNLNWSLVTPNEFSTENNKSLKFINCYLDKEVKIN
jgi:hypothetical protein